MFKRVIVATDLSEASAAMVKCLGGLKPYGAKHCLLLECLTLQEATSVALSYSPEVMEERLAQEKTALESLGFTVEARTVPGFALQEINRVAAEEDYQLVVTGTIKHTLAGEVFMGGLASEIIRHSDKPVLVLRLEARPEGGKQCLISGPCDFAGHVLFPTDFSENADKAFVFLEKMVAAGTKRVTLLHVQDKARLDPHLKHRLEEFNRIDRERLEELKAKLNKKGAASVELEIGYGAPAVEIARVASEKCAGLVVMGSQGRGFVKELLLGSVSHNVARNAAMPVLLVPPAL